MKVSSSIKVQDLGKRYSLGATHRHNSLRDLLAENFRSLFHRQNTQPATGEFWALKEVSFEIGAGESVGIIGLNGAGKSTLLKLLSRIVEPTAGTARIAGRLGALLEVGTGFHGELSGRENVYLYGAILGMTRSELNRKFDAIVDFAGVSDFIDTPVKRYSSGMYVRLAFAVAAHLQPDILLVDEVLSVGDLPFQRKCMDYARSMQRSSAIILFVSHNMFSIKTLCQRVIYLKQGRIIYDGPTAGGIKLYEEDCRSLMPLRTEDRPEEWPISITSVSVSDETGAAKSVFDYGERLKIRLTLEAARPVHDPNIIIAFIRSDGVACCNFSSELDGFESGRVSGIRTIELLTPPLKLVAELYTIHVLVREEGFQALLCAQVAGTFHVRHDLFDLNFGVFHETGEWSVSKPTHGQRALCHGSAPAGTFSERYPARAGAAVDDA